MHDKDIALIKFMLQSINRILEFSSNVTNVEEFVNDYKSYDATLMNFITLGESVGRLSDGFKEKHTEINWRQIYAFRNILAHDYFGIDEDEIWGIIQKHIPKLKTNLEKIIK